MALYRMKFDDSVLGEYHATFMVNDSLHGHEGNINMSGFAETIGECLMNIDLAYDNNSEWQLYQQPRYNALLSNVGLIGVAEAIESSMYPLATPLPSLHVTSGTISTSKLNGNTCPTSNTMTYSIVGAGTANEQITSDVYILPNTPLHARFQTTGSVNTTWAMYWETRVLPSSVLGDENKLHLESTTTARTLIVTINYNGDSATHPYTWQARLTGSSSFNTTVINFFNNKDYERSPVQDTDPWNDDGDPSGDGGGPDSDPADNYDDDSDNNDVPNLPSVSAVDTGFVTLYNPTISQLQSLASYLWGSIFDITTWKKVMADPMDAIIGLSIVPVDVPSSGSQAVTVGNISTGVNLNKASTQFVELDCGTIQFDEKWKAYLDYSPYTRVSIYLPYIGSQELDVDLIASSTIGVKYHIDILSGACVAFITVNGSVIMQFSGQCAISIPITSKELTQTIMSLGTLVASGIGVVATGGMSAPVTGAMIAGGATALANTANNIASSKPTFAKTGNMSGSNGLMGFQTPYLIIERPRKCSPSYQNTYTGYPSYVTRKLSDLSGFTQIQDIHLENISCNDAEHDEIMRLLREGVIL